jgi:hypothetical protein
MRVFTAGRSPRHVGAAGTVPEAEGKFAHVTGVALAGFDALTASEGRQDIHHIPRTKRRTAVPQCDVVP